MADATLRWCSLDSLRFNMLNTDAGSTKHTWLVENDNPNRSTAADRSQLAGQKNRKFPQLPRSAGDARNTDKQVLRIT